jgi:hypothetical protein
VQPHAPQVPDESTITVRIESGETADYVVKWRKQGVPITSIPYSPPVRAAIAYDLETILSRLAPRKYKNFRLPAKGMVVGLGARQPVFSLPEEGFTRRLGGASTDQVMSGVFENDGLRIGYLRLPQFVSTRMAQQAAAELTYFRGRTADRANTDGLVLDLMRNLGGSPCMVEDLLARMIPAGFVVPTAEYRVSWSADEIAEVEFLLASFEVAVKDGTPRTSKLPLCGAEYQRGPVYSSETGEPDSYGNPIVVLVDEFTASAGELMAAVLQDNNRALIVGMRTAGAGGSLAYSTVGVYSEAEMSLAVSIAHRTKDIVTPDLPTAPLLENIGVRPDVELDYMTRDNLLGKGKPFLDRVLELTAARLRAQ